MSLRVGEEWFDCPKGSFVLAPGGVTHDFENRGNVRAGVLNFSAPGPFEPEMPGIAEWFLQNPPKAPAPDAPAASDLGSSIAEDPIALGPSPTTK